MGTLKIIAIVSTIEFQNRALIEAISRKYGNIDVLVKRRIQEISKPKIRSEHVSIDYFHTLFPEKLRKKYSFFNLLEKLWFSFTMGSKLKNYDTAMLCNTHVAYLLPLLKEMNIVSLFVDPYVLMNHGATIEDEREMALKSDVLLCTSKDLASDYCKKYLDVEKTGHYWPNTVDLHSWDINKFDNYAINEGEIVFGYAGNMNEITIDIPLVDTLVKTFPECRFKFAGNLNFSEAKNKQDFEKILQADNVEYLGMVPYAEIHSEVAGWDICLMLDKVYELSKYVHHNKVYQYLALGKVIVGTKTHNDYESLGSEILESYSTEEFIKNSREAIKIARDPQRVLNRIELAKANCSDARAEQFFNILTNEIRQEG